MLLKNKLLAKKAEIVRAAEGNLAVAEKEGRSLTDIERNEDDKLHAELTNLNRDLDICDRHADRTRSVAAAETLHKPDEDEQDRAGAPKKPLKLFSSFGEQAMAAITAGRPGGRIDERLMQLNAASGMSEGSGADGGFMVQRDFSQELLKRTYETGILPALCKRIPIGAGSNGLKINAIDETSRVSTRWGGILGYWVGEA